MRYVLLHAFPLDGSMWAEVAATLRAAGHEVMTPDLRGFGGASLGDDPPDLERMADDVLALLGDRPAILAGCSMGGYVALAIARRRPELVAGLALVDTKATADAQPARDNRERVAALAESGRDWSAGMLEGLLGETTRATRPEVMAFVRDGLARASGPTVAWAQRAMAARPDAREGLAALEIPLVVIVGDEDTVSPLAEQELILGAAASARLVVIPAAGHLTPLEAPEAVGAALLGLAP